MGFLHNCFVYTVASVIGLLRGIELAFRYITNPSAFQVKKRDKPPECLTDPVHGTHGYFSLKGIKIHYVEKGNRSKPLMLFVHGFPEFWYSWRYQMKEFSKDYWTVAIDMRGYGDSEKPSGVKNYTIDLLVSDIKQVVDALGRQKFILVAHDWGGAVAWSFIQKHHDMLESYIILNAPYSPAYLEVVKSNRKQFISSLYVFFFQLPYLPELSFKVNDFDLFRKLFRRNKPRELSPISDEDIEAFKYTFSKPGGFTSPLNYYRANIRSTRNRPKKELDINAPGLMMFGELDDFLILEHMDVAKKYVKKIEVRTVIGANHFVQQDDPDTVNKYIREFLDKR